MLEDVLLIQECHHRAASAILTEVLKVRKEKMVIAISGESGSGKSELTHLIAKGLLKNGIPAKPIHTDNFYKVLPLERAEWRRNHGVEQVVGPDEYDWEAINRVVDDFRYDRRSEMPCVDLVTQRVDCLVTDFREIKALVMDGLYAIKTPGVDLAVMIELTYHETKKSQGSRGKETPDEFRFQVLEAEHQAVLALRPLAHLFVNQAYEVVMTVNM